MNIHILLSRASIITIGTVKRFESFVNGILVCDQIPPIRKTFVTLFTGPRAQLFVYHFDVFYLKNDCHKKRLKIIDKCLAVIHYIFSKFLHGVITNALTFFSKEF